MHITSVNMSALPHCQVGKKQEWSDKWDCIILVIATLPTCNFFYFSAFITTYKYITQRLKKCMSWQFIAWYIKSQQGSHCETIEQWDRQQAAEISMWCRSKKTDKFMIFCLVRNEVYCTDMLTFLKRMPDFVLHNSYCFSLPMKWHAANFCTVHLTCCVSLNRLLTVYRNIAVQ